MPEPWLKYAEQRAEVDDYLKTRGPVDDGGSPPQDPPMDTRLRAAEVAIAEIKATLPNLATKADVGRVETKIGESATDIIKWVVGTAIALGALGLTVMTFVLNNAIPKAATPPPPPPVIVVPASPALPTAPTERREPPAASK